MIRKPNLKAIVIFPVLIVLCLITGTFSTLFISGLHTGTNSIAINKTNRLTDNGSAINGLFKTPSTSNVMKKLKEQQVNVTDKLGSCIFFPNGNSGSVGKWMVENLPKNKVIMQCEIFLNDDLIAKSSTIYPNQHIEQITLLRDIKSGSYDVIAYVNYYDLSSKSYISKAGYKIKMTVG